MIFYVYEYWRPDKNVPFYIGKGSGNRAFNKNARGRYFRRIIRKLEREGLVAEVKKIFRSTDEKKVLAYEIERIAYWRGKGVELVNQSPGGDGTSGYRWTRAQRRTSSTIAKRRWRDPLYRAKQAAAHRRALSKPDANHGTWTKERREAERRRMKAYWADPVNRAKQRAIRETPEAKRKHSEATKRGMADPRVRKRLSKSLRRYMASEARRCVSESYWSRPGERQKAAIRMKALCLNSDFIAKRNACYEQRSRSIRIACRKPSYRQKMSIAVRKAKASPEVRARMREVALAVWALRRHGGASVPSSEYRK